MDRDLYEIQDDITKFISCLEIKIHHTYISITPYIRGVRSGFLMVEHRDLVSLVKRLKGAETTIVWDTDPHDLD